MCGRLNRQENQICPRPKTAITSVGQQWTIGAQCAVFLMHWKSANFLGGQQQDNHSARKSLVLISTRFGSGQNLQSIFFGWIRSGAHTERMDEPNSQGAEA
jgi:hypothetical protein